VEFVISKSWLEVLFWSSGRCFQAKNRNRKYVLLSCELNSGQNFNSLAAAAAVVVVVVVVVVAAAAVIAAAAAVLLICAIP
jgi:hypothetical protein